MTSVQDPNVSSKYEKIIADAMKREIPLLTVDELSTLSRDFTRFRSEFSAWCAKHQFYYTLALLSTCEIEVTHNLPAIAAVTNVDRIAVMFHPLVVELWQKNKSASYFIVMHELRHLIQCLDFKSVQDLVNLDPFRQVYLSKKAQATDPAAIAGWDKVIASLDDPKNRYWHNLKQKVSNVCMDAALHVDVMKLFPEGAEVINEFCRERFVPYITGHPVKEEDKPNIHLQTIASLSESLEQTLKPDGEWLYLCDAYIEWLAKQQDEDMDPNSPPQEGDGQGGEGGGQALQDLLDELSTMDDHQFGENQENEAKRQEAQGRLREAIGRAQQEAALMSHRAGTSAGDAELMGDSYGALNANAKRIIDAIQVKFIRLNAESNDKRHSFVKLNRLMSDVPHLPGAIKETKPQRQVVLLMDTSGSCWDKNYFNLYAQAARHLYNQGKLASCWCFDTEIHKVDFNAKQRDMSFLGGGGTVLRSQHFEDIIKDLGTKQVVDFVILTDEAICWEAGCETDKRWKIHSINVPNIIGKRH